MDIDGLAAGVPWCVADARLLELSHGTGLPRQMLCEPGLKPPAQPGVPCQGGEMEPIEPDEIG